MRRHTQPRHDASLTSYWMVQRIGAAVTVRCLELALGRSDLAARIVVPTATIDQSVREDLQPSTGGQRTVRPR